MVWARCSFNEPVLPLCGQRLAQDRKLQLAARLLESPDVSLAQVGAEVGYESEAAFNRAFKKFVGMPPGAWRRGRVPPVIGSPGKHAGDRIGATDHVAKD